MSAETEKERPAVSKPNALDVATPTTAPSTEVTRWHESDLAQNLTGLVVIILLIVMSYA
jgi:hypothetical protein